MHFVRGAIRAMVLLAFGGALFLPPLVQAQPAALKKRIAVFDFEDKTESHYRWWTGQPVGSGMADMLTTALVKSGKFTVLERSAMDQLLAEQNLGASGIVTPETAVEAGKMLGVEVAVFGAVTEFGHKRSEVGGGVSGIGVGVKSQTASVAVDVRLINTATGEILAAETVRKEQSKKGLRLRTEDFNFNSQSKFDDSLVGKATRAAIDEIVQLIDSRSLNLKWQGKVVTMQGDMVIINEGAGGGVKVGDRFVVIRPGEALIDPDTGLSLGAMETKIGVIEVVNNNIGNGKASQCKIVSGRDFQRGDIVRQP